MNHSQQLEPSLGKRTELICTPNTNTPPLQSTENTKKNFPAPYFLDDALILFSTLKEKYENNKKNISSQYTS